MTKTKAGTEASSNPDVPDPGKPIDSEERVDLDEDNDPEEVVEEEVEYEEVEEEEENDADAEGVDARKESDGDEEMRVAESDKEDGGKTKKKGHSELLALSSHGLEVYLGGISHKVSEADLRGFCKSIGEVTEVRIMKDKDSGEAKGYAFVAFRPKELATKAIEELNNCELKGKRIKCSTAQAQHRLVIGNVPRNWGEDAMRKAVMEIGPGVISVDLLKYYNHACADYSRQKMANLKFKLDDNAPTASWTDPRNAEPSAASQVKAPYVMNLPKDITQDRLKELFEHHGKITKVVIPPAKAGQEWSQFSFFTLRKGQVLDCSLAKPQADQKTSGALTSQKSAFHPSYPPRLGYGIVGCAYGVLGAGYFPAGFVQPMIDGRRAAPASMAILSMHLPDGRVGYVFATTGSATTYVSTTNPTGRVGASSSSSGGRCNSGSGRGHSRNCISSLLYAAG